MIVASCDPVAPIVSTVQSATDNNDRIVDIDILETDVGSCDPVAPIESTVQSATDNNVRIVDIDTPETVGPRMKEWLDSVERRHLNALKFDEDWLGLIGDETPLINPIPYIYAINDKISDVICRQTVVDANSLSEVHLS